MTAQESEAILEAVRQRIAAWVASGCPRMTAKERRARKERNFQYLKARDERRLTDPKWLAYLAIQAKADADYAAEKAQRQAWAQSYGWGS